MSGDPSVSSQPVPARLRFQPATSTLQLYSHFQGPFSSPHHSKFPPTALLYPAATSSCHPSSCASYSVDHLPCPLQGYLHCTSIKAKSVKVTASALFYYRQQGQSFPSSDGAIPCRLPFEPHTPITLSLSVMNWLVPQSS